MEPADKAKRRPNRGSIEQIVKDSGLCCVYLFCCLKQRKEMRNHRRTSASHIATQLGVTAKSIFEMRKRFDSGQIVCEARDCCKKHLTEANSDVPVVVFSYPATIRFAEGDDWLITFRDFPEVKERCPGGKDPKLSAALALEAAIEARISKLLVVPYPGRVWEGDRLIDTPARIAERMTDYKKFFFKKTGDTR